ncbi:NAD-dependent epimerase/dehydratase family protein [Sphingomonas silueang]|uniref:NAD-dependent epimerase/dehydratase family protein n=1 Tax=Sphingomonas silueang TaxID=3156617 RepID=UPI0032B3920E
MSHILVTGSAGFIGYHLSHRLLADGHRVTGFDAMTDYYDPALKRARVARLAALPGYTHVVGRLEDDGALARACGDSAPEIIVHLAAQAGVRYSIQAPRTYVDSNLTGSWAVLEYARQVRPRHLLLASTSSVYGANAAMPFAEHQQADSPMSLYAATKKGMEGMAHSYAHLFGVPTTAFRFFTVYGPWGRPDMALFKFADAMLSGRAIDVYGDGQMARDFTYVDDLVESIVRLAAVVPGEDNRVLADGVIDTLSPVAPFRIVNIAGGQPVPLLDYVRTLETALGVQADINLMPMQPGDVRRTWADASLLRALTGHVPETPVATGVAAFVNWYRGWRAGGAA